MGKVGGSTDRHDILVLLPPSTEERQHSTSSLSLTCLKFLPLNSALLSSDASVLMPKPSSTQHSCPQSLPLPTERVFFRTFLKKGPLVILREVSWVQGRVMQRKSKRHYFQHVVLPYPPSLIQSTTKSHCV